MKRHVALKLIAPELSEDAGFRERFLRESELAASLDHPNVVPIYEAGEADEQLYIAMRYVEGTDLKELLQTERVSRPSAALAISPRSPPRSTLPTRAGLSTGTSSRRTCCSTGEHVYLADFGLSRRLADLGGQLDARPIRRHARLCRPGADRTQSVDGRADEYALGCLLYECLTGEAPFPRASELAVLWAHVTSRLRASEHNPDLPSRSTPCLKSDGKAPGRPLSDAAASWSTAGREALGQAASAPKRRRPRSGGWRGLHAADRGRGLGGLLLSQGGGPGKPSTEPTLTPKVDSLQRIDPKTNKLVATIGAGAGADGIAAGDGAVFVASTDAQTVSRIDPKSNAIVKRASAAGAPTSIASDELRMVRCSG